MPHVKLVFWIVVLGNVILGLMSLAIVLGVVYCSIAFGKAPEILSNWGGLIIGFFVGSFFNFVKTALGVDGRAGSGSS